MVFNSITFLIFFVMFFNLYWLINRIFSIRVRNLFTLLASYIFYGWWDWRFLSLIIISSFSDFIIGLALNKTQQVKSKKWLLFCSIAINLGILGFFKYFDFFIDSLVEILALFSIPLNVSTLKIILPVGISFYTFQTISYTIDIYKGKLKPTRDIISFFTFVAFFPQLVAGPIERARNLLSQFNEKKVFNYNQSIQGLRLILWGLFKKTVLADNFGVMVDQIYDPSSPLSGLSTLVGTLFFAIQIYADFSGYSDMAIGLARTLGINLMTNFRTPYFSASIREFWQRWHISLSTWFRDYLYIPLGGSRKKPLRTAINILITFLLSGLWHGAHITFLIWGSLHGLAYLIEKSFKITLKKWIRIPFVFLVVTLFWIPFRAENTAHLVQLINSLFTFDTYTWNGLLSVIADFPVLRLKILLVVFMLFLIVETRLKTIDFSEWIATRSKSVRWLSYYTLMLLILFLGNFDVKPYFIYFQF